jgi:hypothetical protein
VVALTRSGSFLLLEIVSFFSSSFFEVITLSTFAVDYLEKLLSDNGFG